MIYVQMQLDGRVKICELPDRLLLLSTSIEAEARSLPRPASMDECIEYMRSTCFTLEIFDTFDHLAWWVETYDTFRAGEVKAEFRRFADRRPDELILVAC
jgi:hypothetical protein